MTIKEALYPPVAFTPRHLAMMPDTNDVPNYAYYASPMVHLVTGEMITSYKRLMHDPTTAETWQTAFGRDFGGMAQGDNKIGQKGTDSIFVMKHGKIAMAKKEGKKFTYARIVVDYRPQKEDPH